MVSTPKNPRLPMNRGPRLGSAAAISRPKNRSLLNAEQVASRNLSQFNPQQYRNRNSLAASLDSALTAARAGESTSSDFVNNFKQARFKQDGKKKSRFGKFGPITGLVSALFAFAFFLISTNSLLGAHLSAVITEATDVQFTSANMRNQRLLKYMMGDTKISNFTRKYTNFSPWLKSRLAKNGIEVGKLDSNGNFVKGGTLSTSKTVLKYGDDIITADDFQTRFASDAEFRDSYYKAKRGRVAGFFDDSADRFFTKRGQDRDIFSRFVSTGDNAKDQSNYEKVINDHVVGADATVSGRNKITDEETGEERVVKDGETADSAKIKGDSAEIKARAFVNSVASGVDSVGVPVCSGLKIANVISIAILASQLRQAASFFLGTMEPINKAIAGDGDTVSSNASLNFLTESTSSEYSYVDENGVTKTKSITGSALDSFGAQLILGESAVSPESAAPFSLEAMTKAAKNVALASGASTTACAAAQGTSALVSLVSIAAPGGALVKVAINVVKRLAVGIALTGIVAKIIEIIIPYAIDLFTTDIYQKNTGVVGGELFFRGASSSNFSLATQGSAAMPASQTRIMRQNYETAIALAQEAETERLNHSPFDMSSPHTFMGSIVRQLSTVAFSTNVLTGLNSFSSTVNNSLGSILTNTYASNSSATPKYTETTQECTFLEGATCDIYGNIIPAADFSTIDIAPDDATYEAIISKNLDFTGSVKTQTESATPLSATNTDGSFQYTKYNISDAQLMGLLAVAERENGSSSNAILSEISLMANSYERNGAAPYTADGLIDYVLYSGWIDSKSANAYNELHTPKYSNTIEGAKKILNQGKRTLPKQILIQDCLDCGTNGSDIISASNDGIEFDYKDTSKYIQGKTIIKNHLGYSYTFYQWSNPENNSGKALGYYSNETPDSADEKASNNDIADSVTKNFEDYKIRDGSELAKFITFCVNRESPWGFADSNILGSLQTGNIVLNNLPVANDFLDIINAAEDIDNMGWATGENCMNSENNPRWDSEFKYYQRYVEDMRILGTMSNENDSANPVIAYEKAYEEAHPIDTSFEGTLARISGLSTDDVAFVLEVINYSNELKQYDPTTRYGYDREEEDVYEAPEKSFFAEASDFIASKPKFFDFATTKKANITC